MHIFKKSKIEKKQKIEQKSLKNRMFFGSAILEAFGKGFGRVLGSPNPRFLHFFRYFFDGKFRVQLGRAKNRKKIATSGLGDFFWMLFAVCAGLGGRIIGWGEGKFGLNFKPGLKIGLQG